MPEIHSNTDFDAAIIGGGPAGLSAAIVLGRSRRSVVLFDHGRPRNAASHGVHCFLGSEGATPHDLRRKGRSEAESYGVKLMDAEVTDARCLKGVGKKLDGFELKTADRSFTVRTLLLCTGVVDVLPEIANIRECYGRSVHHCPYCDGWEHRDQRLVAFGDKESVTKLAVSLLTWSPHVLACSNGRRFSDEERKTLQSNDIPFREERVLGLICHNGDLKEVQFELGPPYACDAMFFSSGQFQHSPLTTQLGCEVDEKDMIRTGKKQSTGVNGLFLAGDADGEVQFAIVAAAEGAIAAVAMNHLLQQDDQQ
jgi:thioredoxin reductase